MNPAVWAIGRIATAAVYMTFVTTRSRFLLRWWSTHAPTTSERRLGAQIAAVSTPTSTGLAYRVVTAMSGRASSETRSPSCETV